MAAAQGSLEAALANGAGLLGSDPEAAAKQAREIIRVRPDVADAHRLLGEAERRLGRDIDADAAECAAIDAALSSPDLRQAIALIGSGHLPEAEAIVRRNLARRPFDGAANLLLAQIAVRAGRTDEAEDLVQLPLKLASGHLGANQTLAGILAQQYRIEEAVALLSRLHKHFPNDVDVLGQLTSILGQCGDYEQATSLTKASIERGNTDVSIRLSLAHLLKTLGRIDECASAYRHVIALDPHNGEAWWSLANIKTLPFNEEEIEAIKAALAREDLEGANRANLHFALGKALDDNGLFEGAFAEFAAGNAIKQKHEPYDSFGITQEVDENLSLISNDTLSLRTGWGCEEPGPIFVLGMPRAGSTLVEQILASHSKIEGTSELPIIPMLIQRAIVAHPGNPVARYPGILSILADDEIRALGNLYVSLSRFHRKTRKSLFTDKLPNNWLNIGFILLTLPNAKIIDVRRNALDCCLSNFQQNFARGQGFSYSLQSLGQYYRDYVRLMAHIDEVAPRRIHRVTHENLISDTEGEVRKMLAYLGLEFEPECLLFHQNKRPVRTASAEQVRRPINSSGLEKWKSYDAWLAPLKAALDG